MFTDILAILIVVALVYVIAKINKSTSLFWTLLIPLLMGLVGGALAARVIAHSEKESSVQTVLMQGQPQGSISTVSTVDAVEPCDSTLAVVGKASTKAKLVGQGHSDANTQFDYAPSKRTFDMRAGPCNRFDTS